MKQHLTTALVVFLQLSAVGQEREVSGNVYDKASGAPLKGANVTLLESRLQTSTDGSGKFRLKIPNNQQRISITSVGFRDTTLAILNSSLNIGLVPNTQGLDEVVVVGYGTQKKANLTGSVAAVKMDDLLGDRPVASTAQALQGAAPGLQVVTTTGRPGQGSTLNIRGYTSINGGNPLVLVDNAEVPSIDDINPKDIETISVLKDASSAAIYGARGAFGVILITTKKGKQQQPMQVNYSGNLAFTRASELPVKLNTYETAKTFQKWELKNTPLIADIDKWVELLDDYRSNPANYPVDGIYIDTKSGNRYPLADTYDYWDTAFETGKEHIHNLSIAGGSEKSAYRVSLGYNNQDGVLLTNKDGYKRYNLNSYLQTDLRSNLKTSFNIFYKNDRRKTPAGLSSIFSNGVLGPPYSPNGYYDDPATGTQIPFRSPNNFLNIEKPNLNWGEDIRLYGRLEWKPINKLTIASEYTLNRTNAYDQNVTLLNTYINGANYLPEQSGGTTSSFYKSNTNNLYQSINATALYEEQVGKHQIGGLLGLNYESADNAFFYGQRNDLISQDVPALATANGDIFANDSYYQWAVAGLFGRINYNYDEKYLLELSARYDGSSRFSSRDRYVFVPSGSAGWVITKEAFMDPLKPILSNLKLFGSYGTIGNQNTGSNYYPYLATMATYNAEWIDPATNLRNLTIAAPNLISTGFTWERVKTLNLGVDFGLFANKLTGTAEWYRRETLGMLDAALELPSVLGAKAPLQNVTDLKTKGWDINLTWKDKIGNVHYSIGGNIFDSRAYITNVKLESGNINGLYKGKEIGELWGYQTAGFYNVDDFKEGVVGQFNDVFTLKDGIAPFKSRQHIPGDIRFADVNKDGVVFNGDNTLEDHGDLQRIGNSQRRYQYGINGSLAYGGWDMSFFLQGVGKRDRFINDYLTFPYFTTFTYGIFDDQTDVWTADNQQAFFPRVLSRNYDLSNQNQTRFMYDASYLTIKNVTVGYNLSQKLLTKTKLTKARIFLTGENLYTFDKLPAGVQSDLVAESSGAGYPMLRKFSFGIDVTF